MRLFVGDDWAEDHHDVELMDATGRQLAKARLPEGVAGIARLHGAYYDRQRARGSGHNPALRQLANRLTGILHGCLKTRTLYDEATAWPQYAAKTEKTAA